MVPTAPQGRKEMVPLQDDRSAQGEAEAVERENADVSFERPPVCRILARRQRHEHRSHRCWK